ncbi:uroporphyrin-III C-methyltransferase [Thermincola ferriacetica]|uniref:uroporphyrinogen-III C-methyltransferase n=1 Tax=Thermincola ferriacetica TaxID=281456 RepID=A0A0L6W6M3_9FIRM|nr:uroporphyrinogen-III C-methyltransferase [Thermincola ferriacetica]KNZ71018.1 uroporphyrin-III C-methyltransferase [Thermincola ferriacetica]
MAKGKVYLIGAGPGDPKLITVKGLECIQKADVIVYDRLASPRLLTYARPDAELIYVGKSPDRHTLKQDEINMVLVEKALAGKNVARLKGGDPYVFGRGGEEAEKLIEYGIEFEVVPGITAGIAVPAYAGIPVTHRDFTSTLGIITGNEDPTKEDSSIDWSKISTGIGTLVFYMGMANLPHIVDKLIANGRPADTPIALIRWGTRPEQQTLVGTLADIVDKARAAEFKNPAIIIVGEVVTLRDKLSWFEKKPLFGKRVLVTRSREQASALSEKIEALGGEPWEFPTIDIAEPDDFGPMDRAIEEIEKYDWIILTSVNGVKSFFKRLNDKTKDIRDLKGIRLCAIGPKTREELEKYGLRCDFVPNEYRAEAIIEGLKNEDMSGKKVLLPRADIARKIIPDTLKELGAEIEEVVAYKTVMGAGNAQLLRDMLAEKKLQILTFTSSSTVKNFVQMLDAPNLQDLLADVTVASIGPITSNTAKELGIRVDVEAQEYTIDGLVEAILKSVQ